MPLDPALWGYPARPPTQEQCGQPILFKQNSTLFDYYCSESSYFGRSANDQTACLKAPGFLTWDWPILTELDEYEYSRNFKPGSRSRWSQSQKVSGLGDTSGRNAVSWILDKVMNICRYSPWFFHTIAYTHSYDANMLGTSILQVKNILCISSFHSCIKSSDKLVSSMILKTREQSLSVRPTEKMPLNEWDADCWCSITLKSNTECAIVCRRL